MQPNSLNKFLTYMKMKANEAHPKKKIIKRLFRALPDGVLSAILSHIESDHFAFVKFQLISCLDHYNMLLIS